MSFLSATRYTLAVATILAMAATVIETVSIFYPGSGRTATMLDAMGDVVITMVLAWIWGLLPQKDNDRSKT